MQAVFSNANEINLFLVMFPCISLHGKLAPVQHHEYKYGLLFGHKCQVYHFKKNMFFQRVFYRYLRDFFLSV